VIKGDEMNRTLKRLTFATMLALSLLASSTSALAKQGQGRETAWTDNDPVAPVENVLDPLGVTWEE
jgi:hypothetical protein